jgi:hypothetical protein
VFYLESVDRSGAVSVAGSLEEDEFRGVENYVFCPLVNQAGKCCTLALPIMQRQSLIVFPTFEGRQPSYKACCISVIALKPWR